MRDVYFCIKIKHASHITSTNINYSLGTPADKVDIYHCVQRKFSMSMLTFFAKNVIILIDK